MVLKEYSLEGKVAIVTGAGRGLGRAIASTLAEAGADIVAAARTVEQLDETAEEIRHLGRRCLTIPTDVTKAKEVEDMVDKAISEFGKVDILVNNAGVAMVKPLVPMPGFHPPGVEEIPNFFTPTSEEEWRRVLDTNLTGAFLCTRAVGPHMLRQGKGKIINISSVEGGKGLPFHAMYTTSKAALNMFTRSMALEWARYNINVNAIGPGFFHTAMSARDHEDPRLRERLLKSIPLRRTGELRDIGLLAVYLASDASNYMTGQVIYLDGGYLA